MKLNELINQSYSHFSESDHHILRWFLEHPDQFNDLTIEQLAKRCASSPASVYRTIKKLGFQGYSEFKYYMINQANVKPTPPSHNYKELMLENMQITLNGIQEEVVQNFFDALDESEHRYIYGTGWKQAEALKSFSNDLLTYTKPFTPLHTVHDLKSTAERMHKGDVLVVSSLYGYTEGIADILKILTLKGITTVSITAYGINDIAKASRLKFYYKDDNLDDVSIPWPASTLKALLDYLVYAYMVHCLNKKA